MIFFTPANEYNYNLISQSTAIKFIRLFDTFNKWDVTSLEFWVVLTCTCCVTVFYTCLSSRFMQCRSVQFGVFTLYWIHVLRQTRSYLNDLSGLVEGNCVLFWQAKCNLCDTDLETGFLPFILHFFSCNINFELFCFSAVKAGRRYFLQKRSAEAF